MKLKAFISAVMLAALGCTTGGAQGAIPDFGPNVLVFDSSMTNIQERVDAVFREQERSEFGSNRYAFLFKPGDYHLDVKVGFYMEVLGIFRLRRRWIRTSMSGRSRKARTSVGFT